MSSKTKQLFGIEPYRKESILFDVDSYKTSQYLQYIPGMQGYFGYGGSRKSTIKGIDAVTNAGLQPLLIEYMSDPFTQTDLVQAREFYSQHNGYFNFDGFKYILNKHGGHLPVEIQAIKEGTILPIGVPQYTVTSTDPEVAWAGGWVETRLLRALWYSSTVATISRRAKEIFYEFWKKTSTEPVSSLEFKLHDFGARGVSSLESAHLGGVAHLFNFMGSDTISGAVSARNFYGSSIPAAFSIAAAEHSTITVWGMANEADAYLNMIKQFGNKKIPFAIVSDAYDIQNAVDNIYGKQLKQAIMEQDGTLVVRPDSGKPVDIVMQTLRSLANSFGFTVNDKGFKVLNKVRVIQGDGVNLESIQEILEAMVAEDFSIDNIFFGMGGALLQKLDRDTFNYAMKMSAADVNGQWRDVFKQPKTDSGKNSLKGKVGVFNVGGAYYVDSLTPINASQNLLRPVFRNGEILQVSRFDEVRKEANSWMETA